MQNIGVLITAFVLSGGYLVAINKLKEFQEMVREVPSDYFLTPLVLVLVLFFVLMKINRSQQEKLSKFEQKPEIDESDARFVTHLGVWWKIYLEGEYIEDFPYCSCCDPRLKLVQIDWHPDEVFKCSRTNTEYKLYDKIPREREDVLEWLYGAYFHGIPEQFRKEYLSEIQKIKELNSDIHDSEITNRLFNIVPLSRIPNDERECIVKKFPDPMQALRFVERNFDSYKKYLKKNGRWKDDDEF